jgi:hypothetical protein
MVADDHGQPPCSPRRSPPWDVTALPPWPVVTCGAVLAGKQGQAGAMAEDPN